MRYLLFPVPHASSHHYHHHHNHNHDNYNHVHQPRLLQQHGPAAPPGLLQQHGPDQLLQGHPLRHGVQVDRSIRPTQHHHVALLVRAAHPDPADHSRADDPAPSRVDPVGRVAVPAPQEEWPLSDVQQALLPVYLRNLRPRLCAAKTPMSMEK